MCPSSPRTPHSPKQESGDGFGSCKCWRHTFQIGRVTWINPVISFFASWRPSTCKSLNRKTLKSCSTKTMYPTRRQHLPFLNTLSFGKSQRRPNAPLFRMHTNVLLQMCSNSMLGPFHPIPTQDHRSHSHFGKRPPVPPRCSLSSQKGSDDKEKSLLCALQSLSFRSKPSNQSPSRFSIFFCSLASFQVRNV